MSKFKASQKQWIKFIVAAIVFIVFSIWLGNLWILIGLSVIFDIYISKYIPWTWWKQIKNPSVKKIFEWADAIIFALVAVYFINVYLFQNYKIPSGSLEKTLLVGDHLFVSKLAYGPRTPNTPLSFPLVQHTFPIINTKSYIEHPQMESRRLKGVGKVERNDIVVFNFPAGDTIVVNNQKSDYESICYDEAVKRLENKGLSPEMLQSQGINVRAFCLKIGREIVEENNDIFGDIVYRPVDRRENYVKRCVGLPGDTLQVIDRELYINGVKQERQEGIQHYCEIHSNFKPSNELLDQYEVSIYKGDGVPDKEFQIIENKVSMMQQADDTWVYYLPLTAANAKELRENPAIVSVEEINFPASPTFPVGYNLDWTVDNYGPIWIPKKGETVTLSLENLALFERVIRNYEGNTLEIREGKIFINNEPATSYTFAMDYYWLMGDNRHNSADSRAWGYVPENHVVGQPLFVWLSLNPNKGWFSGKIRFSRFFKDARN